MGNSQRTAFENYEKIVATSRNIQSGMQDLGNTFQKGGYAEATQGARRRSKREQLEKISITAGLEDYMAMSTDTSFGQLGTRLGAGSYSGLQADALAPGLNASSQELQKMREEVDRLTLLAGIPRLSDSERTEIQGMNTTKIDQMAAGYSRSQLSDDERATIDELDGGTKAHEKYKRILDSTTSSLEKQVEALAQLAKVRALL